MKRLHLACSPYLVFAALTAVCGSACNAEEPQLLSEGAGFEAAVLRDGPSEAFLDARRAIDESVFTIEQADQFEWSVLEDRLIDLAGYIDPVAMTPTERDEIDAYAADAGADIEAELLLLSNFAAFPGIEIFNGTCYTRCMGFLEVACENSQVIGVCAGLWGCSAELGAHVCMESGDSNPDQGDCGGETCASGWRCARWAFKADECVQECDSNSDCPSGEKCKKPFGTSFHRCK